MKPRYLRIPFAAVSRRPRRSEWLAAAADRSLAWFLAGMIAAFLISAAVVAAAIL